MKATVDKYGIWTIPLEREHNTEGYIKVDGDLYDVGPVVILRFEITGEDTGDEEEVDFGTFRLNFPRGTAAAIFGGVMLGEESARELVAAILAHIDEKPA